MQLTGQQLGNLHTALLDAYPTYSNLKRMLKFQLERELSAIVSDRVGQEEVVFELIEAAKAQGWLKELIVKAYEFNRENEKLCAFMVELKHRNPNIIETAQEDTTFQDLEEERLYRGFLELNYYDQVALFRRFIGEYKTGAFLIYGDDPYQGQRFLLNRLFVLVDYSINSLVIRIALYRYGQPVDIEAIWYQLGDELKLEDTLNLNLEELQKKILERIQQIRETRPVILIVDDIGRVNRDYLQQLVDELWCLLAASKTESVIHHVVMFVIDYIGHVNTLDITCVEKFEAQAKAHLLVKLKKTGKFSEAELRGWFTSQGVNSLPYKYIDQVEAIIQCILVEQDNQVREIDPVTAFKEICKYCGYNWYSGEKKWFKL